MLSFVVFFCNQYYYSKLICVCYVFASTKKNNTLSNLYSEFLQLP